MSKYKHVAAVIDTRYNPPPAPALVDPKDRTDTKLDPEKFKAVKARLSEIYVPEAPEASSGTKARKTGNMGPRMAAKADSDSGSGTGTGTGTAAPQRQHATGGDHARRDAGPHPAHDRGAVIAQAPSKPAQEYVEVKADGNLRVLDAAPEKKQANVVLTNALGNTHGLLIEEDKLVLSGGLHSTNLQLDDDGATFSDVGTGNAVVVSGVAAGQSAQDAANVGQLQAAVDPLNARMDGVEDRVQQLDRKIKATEKKLSAGVAMALALNQPVSFAPQSQSAVTGGMATYNGQSAVGFSFHRLVADTQTRRTMVSMGVGASSSGRGSACARVGACFSW